MGASNALVSAEIALSGIQSVVPIDEAIEVMYRVGRSLPVTLRETSQGGTAMAQAPAMPARQMEKSNCLR